jgi:drug/metabolite transporter (DMT)-like permease
VSTEIFLLVLLAAFLHAGWNVLIKLNADRLVSLTVLQSLMALLGLAMVAWFGLPSQLSLIFALVSGLLHTGYNLFLVRAYKSADLSQVYPIARGTAPLLTLIGAWVALNDAPGWIAMVAILTLVLGLLLTAFGGSKSAVHDPHAVFYALGTACFIAVYTLVDGQGARHSGNAFGYAGAVFVLDGLFMLIAGLGLRGIGFARLLYPHWRHGLLGALASGAAYAIVLWAMTEAPIASVAALRETSIVFVLLMSARLLREALTWQRMGGGLLIVAGAVLLRLA